MAVHVETTVNQLVGGGVRITTQVTCESGWTREELYYALRNLDGNVTIELPQEDLPPISE